MRQGRTVIDTYTYVIRLREQIDERELSAMSPLAMTVQPAESGATAVTVRSDQAGLIGLLRYLHGLGCVLLSVNRVDGD